IVYTTITHCHFFSEEGYGSLYIYVCVKQTPDSASVYIDPISGQVDEERFVQVLNPADACAVEAAVRIKEQLGGTIMALTLGPENAESALRAALAIGVDSAVRLWNPQAASWGPFTVASVLAEYLRKESTTPDLVMCGDSASDWSSGIVGAAMAEKLDLPQITAVAQLDISKDSNAVKLHVTRKLERGYRELLEAELPLLITVTSDLNEPRYPALPAHIAALRANISVHDALTFLSNIGQEESEETTLLEMHTPRPRARRIVAPDSRHSAFERIGEIITGGATGRQARLVEGSPEQLAQALVQFLQDKGF
ncbi:MAG: electron transfer flavoprotein subunit beta/FixA family protein, partial [Ktedonobacteraceae bacterium]